MKTLYIAEKPELARAIAGGIGGNFKKDDGFLTDGQNLITWCFGHVLGLKEPEDYDAEKYGKWSLEQLPMAFYEYDKKPKEHTKKQFMVIKKLIKEADIIVNAGDIDEEGQLLVDEVIRFCGTGKKPIKRVLINDNSPKLVAKAVANLEDNSKYEHLGWKAEARSIADFHFGINLSRGYSVVAQNQGSRSTISVGRVQTAILGMIVRRDREVANHKKAFYHILTADFKFGALVLPARYLVDIEKVVNGAVLSLDDKKRMIDKAQATSIAGECQGKASSIIVANTTNEKTPPPLPYSLLALQIDCEKKFGIKPKKVMEITQSLREKHNLITYNRSDSRYLSDEQHSDAPTVLNAIKQTLSSDLGSAVAGADSSIKSRAFNSANVTAHHAIIPTATVGNINSLSDEEKKIYQLIATAYISQFYPAYEYLKTSIEIEVEGNVFAVSSSLPLSQGWKSLGVDGEEDEKAEDDNELSVDLRSLKVGDSGVCSKTTIADKETKPKPLYTMPLLLKDFTRVADYVKSPELAKILRDKDKDKGKKGENGGIGTSATRDSIIELLFKRGFIVENKKKITSTPQGQALYDGLSDEIRFPDTSAIWAGEYEKIKTKDDVLNFLRFVMDMHVIPEIEKLKGGKGEVPKVGIGSAPKAPLSKKTFPCPKCGRDLQLRETKFGKAWGCSGFFDKENQCKTMFKDDKGKPLFTTATTAESFKCVACERPLAKRNGQYGDFWGCTGFFDKENQCKKLYKMDDKGKPIFN